MYLCNKNYNVNIDIENLEQLENPGVYKILNIINNKYYIGSTKMKIRLRLNHHIQALRNNNHKNIHLQRAWNKYGEENFKFLILENCVKDIVYDREQFYLDNRDVELSYNINPNATGFSENLETLEKLKKSHAIYNSIASYYYCKVKNNEITLEEVPVMYHNSIKSWLNHVPWNKGKKYDSTEHLKVKHRFTEKLKNKCKKFSEQYRENSDTIYVYDLNWNFVDVFRSSKDLADLSKLINLPMKSRFKAKRGNCETNELQSCNVNRAVKTGKSYKGLYFRNKPLHQGIDDVNEPKSVKNWNVNTEVSTETKESVPPYSIGTEPDKSE